MRKNLAYIFITLILAVLPAWANVDVNALTWIKSLPGVTLNSSNSVKHEYTISSEKNYSQVITGLQQRGWRYTAQRKNPECPNMPEAHMQNDKHLLDVKVNRSGDAYKMVINLH